MTVPRTVAEILRDHVTLEVEGIDRMYLNAIVPILQSERGIAWFFLDCRGYTFASSALMAPFSSPGAMLPAPGGRHLRLQPAARRELADHGR